MIAESPRDGVELMWKRVSEVAMAMIPLAKRIKTSRREP